MPDLTFRLDESFDEAERIDALLRSPTCRGISIKPQTLSEHFMGRRKGTPVHGWLILDKPQSMTSTHALNKVKRLFDAEKAGHAGTLDPLATGVLPIAFGEATKTIPHVMDSEKGYSFLVRWGAETRPTTPKARP